MSKDFIAGGYFILKPEERPDFLDKSFPDSIISLSECICHRIPDFWSYMGMTAPTQELIDTLCLNERAFHRICNQAELYLRTGEIQWPNVFRTLSGAQSFIRNLPLPAGNLIIVGCGLHRDDYNSYMEGSVSASEAPCGVSKVLVERYPLAEEGEIAGYDVLGDDVIGSHSWLCHHIMDGDQAGILSSHAEPNAKGYLDSFKDACRLAKLANSDKIMTEPVRWFPWQIKLFSGERRGVPRPEQFEEPA